MEQSHQIVPDTHDHCTSCGACCAHFRVSFYWAEAEQLGIPDSLITPLTPVYSCMTGTHQPKPRCQALAGDIGRQVACTIYPQRPSPCHEVQVGDEKCNRARQRHGLPPINVQGFCTAEQLVVQGSLDAKKSPEGGCRRGFA